MPDEERFAVRVSGVSRDPERSRAQMSVPAEDLPPGGIEGEIQFVFAATEEERNSARLDDRTERDFEVRAALSKTPALTQSLENVGNSEAGESFFLSPQGTDAMGIRAEGMFIEFELNAARELSVAKASVRARYEGSAVHRFMAALSPFLDILAFRQDAPISVDRVQVTDTTNKIVTLQFTGCFHTREVEDPEGRAHRDLVPFLALYREALANRSPFYKLLCFFKIMEEIYKSLRPRLRKSARNRSIVLPPANDVFPALPEIQRFRPELIGKPIGEIYQKQLLPKYRNGIAHFVEDGKYPVCVSDYGHYSTFAREVFVAQVCARQLITNESSTLDIYAAECSRKGISSGNG